jgi:hypothetical protein
VRLDVRGGVLDPEDVGDWVMVGVHVFEADEPAVAEREGVPATVSDAVGLSVGAAVRERVSVAETEAPGRERVAVPLAVPLAVAPGRERVAVPLIVDETEAPGRERVAVPLAVGETGAPGRERVAVPLAVGETGAPGRERVAVPLAVGETGAPGRERVEVPLAVTEPARDRVAVPPVVPLVVPLAVGERGWERVAVAVAVPTGVPTGVPTAERLRTAGLEGVTGAGVPAPPPVPCVQPVDDRRAKNTRRSILSSYSYIT